MHEYGTKREHFGNVAIAARKHAHQNPFAMMRDRPLDMETYLAGRVIGYPLTLYDCCLETDGALACIVTTIERARDLRQKPVLVHAVAQASGPNPVHLANYNNTQDMVTTSVVLRRPPVEALASSSPKDMRLRADLRRVHAARDHAASRTTASASAARAGRSPRAAASSSAARCRC